MFRSSPHSITLRDHFALVDTRGIHGTVNSLASVLYGTLIRCRATYVELNNSYKLLGLKLSTST